MNAEQAGYVRKLVNERLTLLPRFIKVEDQLAAGGTGDTMTGTAEEVAEARETAAKRAAEYREELTLAESVLAALGHPEHAQHRFCMVHGHAHPDTGDPRCEWQAGT